MTDRGKDFDPSREENPFRTLSPEELQRLQDGAAERILEHDPLHDLRIFSATDLRAMDLPTPKYIVDGVLPEGASLLVAKPKVGKSMLMQHIAVAIASGGKALGKVDVEQGRVLYLLLEGSKRGLKRRIEAMIPTGPWPECLHFAQAWPRADQGGIDLLERFIATYPDTRLIIVDTLQHIRARADTRRMLYEVDHEALYPFSVLYEKTGVSFVVIHHANKRDAGSDVVDMVSGSTGLSGAVENVLAMVREDGRTTLMVRPREEEEVELALDFDPRTMTWMLRGRADLVVRTDERQEVLDVLAEATEPMRAAEIAALVGKPKNNVSQLLFKLKHQGKVDQPKYSYYALTAIPSKTDKTDKTKPQEEG